PELHLVVCTPRDTDFPKKFQIMANYEIQDRQVRFATLPDARAALFHPVGFPGRPSRLESTVVVVDDQWALVGSSTFRQRGLRFDGGSDLVFTDTVLENGVCPAIADFRRRVMANRLGLAPLDTGMPHPNYVRLFDGVEAFHVVKETLAVGGLGKIEPLWKLPDDAITPAPAKHANPNGVDVTADANLSLYVELFAQALITT
ncbi:MAG TPA: hypothetical protein VEX60_00190, partial [Pyrinomonadaceae bacterium]|nr:hypothetical protein [Pyrinomonadaceae bacterium]